MLFKVKSLGLLAGRPVAILHHKTAKKLNIHVDERVEISFKKKRIISIVDIVKGLLKENEVVLSEEIIQYLGLKKGQSVEIIQIVQPKSLGYIREKIKGIELNEKKIHAIISDIVSNNLTESEIAYFIAAEYINRMNINEISALIKAIVNTGNKLELTDKVIADKHSIGGIAGNRTTPIVVSICAAAGLIMPKTSSRAITSAAGTADVIETIADVEFSIKEIRRIIKKTNACLVWGGALGLAPADDKIIQVERLLNLDPEAQLLASILSKKVASGSTHVIIDIPCGKSAKFTYHEGKKLERKFIELAKRFNIKLKTIITRGDEPIGNGIGPVLEMQDVLRVLRQEENRPRDLEKKSIILAANLLELTEEVKKGGGMKLATELLESKAAFKKFKQIIEAQNGAINHNHRLKLARYKMDIKAKKSGKIREINNKKINAIARAVGCPTDKAAGLYLWKHCNKYIKKHDKLITLYAESKIKLEHAKNLFRTYQPIKVK
jgi:AMP phosphorylase